MAEFDDLSTDDIAGVEDTQSKLQSSFYANEGVSPDRRAEAIKLSDKFNTPVEFVEKEFDSFSTQANRLGQDTYEDLVNNYPTSTEFLADPVNNGLAQDDVEGIKSIERKAGGRGYFGKLYDSVVRGSLRVAEGVNEFAEMNAQNQQDWQKEWNANHPASEEFKRLTGRDFTPAGPVITAEQRQEFRNYIGEKIKGYEDEDAQKSFITEISNGNFGAAAESLSLQVAESIPQLALVAVNAGLGLSTLYASETGSKYKENVDAGVAPDLASQNAKITGAISTGIESLGGFGNPLKQVIGRAAKEVGTQSTMQVLKQASKEILKAGGEEGLEEAATTLAQGLADYGMGVDDNALDGIALKAADSFFVGAGSGVSVGAGSHGLMSVAGATKRYSETAKASINAKTYEDLGEVSVDSKLRKRSPEKFEQFVQKNAEGSGIENVYVPTEAVERFFQTKDQSATEEMAKLGILEEYEKAKAQGSDIQLPTGKWINKTIDTELYAAVKNDVKFDPADLTENEIKKQNDDLKYALKVQKDSIDKAEAEGSEIVGDIYKQLVGAGVSKSEAKAQSTLYSAISVMAQREGLSPKALYDRYGLKVISSELTPSIADGDVYNQTKEMFNPTGFESSKFGLPAQVNVVQDYGRVFSSADDIKTEAIRKLEGLVFINNHTGMQIEVKKGGLKRAVGTLADEAGKRAMLNLPKLIENAVYARTEKDKKGGGNDKFIFYAPLKAGPKEYLVKITAQESNGKLFYDKYAIEKERAVSEVTPDQPGNQDTARTINIADLVKDVQKIRKSYPLFQESNSDGSDSTKTEQASGQYDPVNRIITLFKGKDKSTFLHESGHFFLDVLGDLATREGASDAIKKDYAEVLKYLGVDSKDNVKRDQHELWARTFETYLMEGKAPSSALRKAFDSFKLWLIDIYKNAGSIAAVAGFEVNITDEIRGVMDRMISADTEIEAAESQVNLNVLLRDPISAGMNPEKAAKYKETIQEARSYAEAELTKKLMDSLNKKQRKEYKEKFAEEVKAAKLELLRNPVYETLEILKRGKDLFGREYDIPIKLDKDEVVRTFGQQMADRLPKNVYRKGGLSFETVSEMFGFENPSEMMADLAAAEDIDKLANRQAEEKLKGEYPDLFNEPEIKPEAVMALHNEKRSQVLKYELEFLQEQAQSVIKDATKRLIKRAPLDQEIRRQASLIIANEKVQDIKPYLYLRAESNMSKLAAEAFAKGDVQKAFEYKRAERLNYELYRSSIEAADNINNTVKRYKKLFKANEDLSKSRDMDYVNAARAVLQLYGIVGGKNEDPIAYLKKTEKYDPERFNSIQSILADALEGAGQYTNVPYDQFLEMKNTVDALWDISKDAKQVVIDGKAMDLDTIVNDLKTTIEADAKKTGSINIEGTVSDQQKAATKFLTFFTSNKIVLNWADLMDSGNAQGYFKKYIWYPVSEAAAVYRNKSGDLKKEFKSIVEEYADIFKDGKIYTGDELTINRGSSDKVTFSFKKPEILMMLLHTGNDSNKSKLLRGGRGYKGEQYAWGSLREDGTLDSSNFDNMMARFRSEGVLTKRDYEFAQKMWDLMESQKATIQKAHKKMEGFYFNEITANEVVTEFGNFRGGYMPAKIDVYTNEKASIRKEREDFENNNSSFAFPTISKGSTMSRIDAYAAPLSLEFNLLSTHLDWTMKYAHLKPTIKDVTKIVLNEEFRSSLASVDENAGKELLVPWLQRAAEQKIVVPSQGDMKFVDATARFLRTRFSLNVLALSFTNAFQNFGSTIISASKLPAKNIIRSNYQLVKNRAETMKFITESSEFMKSEMDDAARKALGMAEDIIINASASDKIGDKLREYSGILDNATTSFVKSQVWFSSYEYQTELGADHKTAVRLSDDLTRSITSVMNAEDVSRVLTGSETKLFFTQFIGYFNRLLNFRASELAKIHKSYGLKNAEGMKRALPFIMLSTFIPAAYSAIVSKALAGKLGEDDDGDGYLDEIMSIFFGSAAKESLVGVPYVGQIATYAINKYNKNPMDDKLTLAPSIGLIDLAVSLPAKLIKDAGKDELKKQTVKDALTVVGVISNLPVGYLGKPIGYMMDVKSGKARPKNELDFGRGIITGQPGK